MTLFSKNICMVMIASSAIMTSYAQDLPGVGFGYSSVDTYEPWGTTKSEDYDIAILVKFPDAVGKQISGVRFPVSTVFPEIEYEAWASSELKLTSVDGSKVNDPDGPRATATIENGYARAIFDNPVTVPEHGIYIGYTMTAKQGASMPTFPVVAGREKAPGSFFVHSSKTYRNWSDKSEEQNMTSGLMAIINDASFQDVSVSLESLEIVNVRGGLSTNTLPAVIANWGREGIESFEYEYKIGEFSGTLEYTFHSPVRNQYGFQQNIKLPLPVIDNGGSYPSEITITKVNGKENPNTSNVNSTTVNVMEFNPTRMAVLEEYTGTWCQFCPRGWLGLEMMYERYPDRFIGISYHANDVMQMRRGWPQVSNAYPDAWIDRVHQTDSYAGDLPTNEFGIDLAWEQACLQLSEASIFINTTWLDDERIEVKSFTTFAADMTEEYRVEYVLIADDLHGEGQDWLQVNGFAGNEDWRKAEGMAQFVDGEMMLENFRYNSVAILTSGLYGVQGSLPNPRSGQTIEHTYVLDTRQAVNDRGLSLVQDRTKLRVVAMVLKTDDSYGTIVNAAICKAGESGDVDELITEASDIVDVKFFNLDGRRVSPDTKGMMIKVSTDNNGQRRVTKILNK